MEDLKPPLTSNKTCPLAVVCPTQDAFGVKEREGDREREDAENILSII